MTKDTIRAVDRQVTIRVDVEGGPVVGSGCVVVERELQLSALWALRVCIGRVQKVEWVERDQVTVLLVDVMNGAFCVVIFIQCSD